MDLIIIVILVAFTFVFFRRIDNVVYIICIIDLFLRIINKINSLLNISALNDIVSKYLPSSILGIINNYSSGIINNILVWFYIAIYVVFLGYLIKYFFKKKK